MSLRYLSVGMFIAILAMSACAKKHSPSQAVVRVPNTALCLPQLSDWIEDTTVVAPSAQDGGLMLRLVQRSSVPGSPRIEVRLAPPQPGPMALEAYLTQNLRDMGAMESAGQIRIMHVDQQPITIGHTPGYRVHHEFTSGTGSSQVSLYQVSTFLVFEGRGITVSAAGRTELFHPLATSIAGVLDGIMLDAAHRPRQGFAAGAPIDLGTLGGSRP
jgi:hypothetical protein